MNDSSDSSEEEKEEASNAYPSDGLFIRIIDINKCEEDARNLYNKLLTDGDNLKLTFGQKLILLMLKEISSDCQIILRSLGKLKKFWTKWTMN